MPAARSWTNARTLRVIRVVGTSVEKRATLAGRNAKLKRSDAPPAGARFWSSSPCRTGLGDRCIPLLLACNSCRALPARGPVPIPQPSLRRRTLTARATPRPRPHQFCARAVPLDFDDEVGLKSTNGFSGIAALIAKHSGTADGVVDAVMGMSVNP